MSGFVYMLECSDKTLYTGWTRDVERRVEEHNSSKAGARYTRSRRPVKLVYVECCSSTSEAMKREAAIKAMSRQEKMQLIKTGEP